MYLEEDNILDFIESYLISLNINHDELAIFAPSVFEKCCIIRLPEVCIVSENRNTRSHQSHIHITGNNMSLFFPEDQLAKAKEISYENQDIVLSLSNISSLNHSQSNSPTLDLIETTARKKLATRMDGSIQVQLGERRNDSVEFNNLRKGLYENDLLVILKYKDRNKLFILGIPHAFYEKENYSIKKGQDYFEIQSNDSLSPNYSNAFSFDNRTNDLSIDIQDTIYQDQIQNLEVKNIVSPALTYNPTLFDSTSMSDNISHRPKTNPNLALAVIQNNNYRCAFDTESAPHETFISISGHPYIEAHHLIPLSKQPLFKYKLDTVANIVPLCPNCHRKIHNGTKPDREQMIKELYEKMEKNLKKSIPENISLQKILEFY